MAGRVLCQIAGARTRRLCGTPVSAHTESLRVAFGGCSVCDGYAFLTMERALRLVSRLAGRGLGGGDVLPPTVERIAGDPREAMVAAMDALTSDDSPVLERLERFFEEHPTNARNQGAELTEPLTASA